MGAALFDTRPVQMNVRMNRQLKEAGDAVLSHMGMTPSQAVRSLWECLVVQNKIPDGIKSADLSDGVAGANRAKVAQGPEIIRNFYIRTNISVPQNDELPDSDELYAAAMNEKYRDWICE